MVKIYVDNEPVVDCKAVSNMRCETCVLSEVCDGDEVRITGEEFAMLENCKYMRATHFISCDKCPSRFVCYTSKINKYAGKPISWVLNGASSR